MKLGRQIAFSGIIVTESKKKLSNILMFYQLI